MNKDDTTKKPIDNEKEDKLTDENSTNDEVGGRPGLDPVRYGDWEIGGKCVDF